MTSFAPPLPPSLPPWAREALNRLAQRKATLADRLWLNPGLVMTEAALPPDPWQVDLLRSTASRMLLRCSRQAASLFRLALALKTAILKPSLILLLSPTQRQSGELFRDKFLRLYHPWARCARRPGKRS